VKRSIFRSKRSAFDNPIRVKLLELISEGVCTVNDLAEVIGINRINLYHHLNTLEKEGVIEGSFKGSRIKTYRLVDESTVTETNSPSIGNNLMSERITIIPNESNREEITKLVGKIVTVGGGIPPESSSVVIQVDVMFESKNVNIAQRKKATQFLSKKSKGN